ncbi:hypothetical protein C464_16862 [Halorubrum coriense DSM 10284]|uniref:Uncharacterized protein n=1 Tax=Halorubrum coriense DSM 10284 TaxID=1227466 RepID=M0E959_9EURY|nr:hypothetical protein [Halorubrum coriense]ELZ43417.1 hypothetical protein C464_16862 [Halorubrum coriense DSM 10284]
MKFWLEAGQIKRLFESLLIAVQVASALTSVLAACFWAWLVGTSLVDPKMFKPGQFSEYFMPEFHPGVLGLAVVTGLPALAVHYLYWDEDIQPAADG